MGGFGWTLEDLLQHLAPRRPDGGRGSQQAPRIWRANGTPQGYSPIGKRERWLPAQPGRRCEGAAGRFPDGRSRHPQSERLPRSAARRPVAWDRFRGRGAAPMHRRSSRWRPEAPRTSPRSGRIRLPTGPRVGSCLHLVSHRFNRARLGRLRRRASRRVVRNHMAPPARSPPAARFRGCGATAGVGRHGRERSRFGRCPVGSMRERFAATPRRWQARVHRTDGV